MECREAGCVDDQRCRGTQYDHHRSKHRACDAKPTMDVDPRGSDQRDLYREQHQPADEGDRMKVHDQRIIEAVFAHVLEAVGPKARQHADPDEDGEQKKRAAIRTYPRRKASHSYCCYFSFLTGQRIKAN